MSTQIRGLAPATRVMSRREPPAAASGSCPSTRPEPAWLTSRFASACGRWLVRATSRSCACGSIATGTAPSAGDESVDEPVALGVGLGESASGTRSRPRRDRRSRARRPAPREPQTGWPPTNRAEPRAAAQTALFVEPTSVTVQRSPLDSSAARTWAASCATGAATTARSASARAAASDSAGSSTAPRATAASSAAESESKPETRVEPERFAASATEAPIRPVPTIARRSGATGSG